MRLLACATILIGLAICTSRVEARWLKAETPNFRIYSEGSERELRRQAVVLEDYHQLLRLLTNTTKASSPVKLEIYLARNMEPLRVARGHSSDVRGFYSAAPDGIAAFSMRGDEWGLDDQEVLFHEYAHHFMLQYYPAGYPAWVVEGFAEYMMTAKFTDKKTEFGGYNLGRAAWIINGKWLPASRLLAPDEAKPFTPDERAMYYAESWLAAHYMYSAPGRAEALQKFVSLRAAGTPDEEAFKTSFGMDFAAFDKVLRAYARGKLLYTTVPRASDRQPVDVAITVLPDAADDLLLPGASLRLGLDDRGGEAMLARIRRAASNHAGDPFARATLAHAELLFGDRAKARGLLDTLIASDPANAQYLYLRGYCDLLDGREQAGARSALFDRARHWFARAHRADANHYPTLFRYVETLSLKPLAPSTVDVLVRAQELAPQVDEISVTAAIVLMRNKQFKSAETLLMRVASNPHSGSGKAARALLDRAKAEQPPDVDVMWAENKKGGPAGPPSVASSSQSGQRE